MGSRKERRGVFGRPEETSMYRSEEGYVAVKIPDQRYDKKNRRRRPMWILIFPSGQIMRLGSLRSCRYLVSSAIRPWIRTGRRW